MKVIDANKVGRYICTCGRTMIVKDMSLTCPVVDCEHYEELYKIPDSVFIELERINDDRSSR